MYISRKKLEWFTNNQRTLFYFKLFVNKFRLLGVKISKSNAKCSWRGPIYTAKTPTLLGWADSAPRCDLVLLKVKLHVMK